MRNLMICSPHQILFGDKIKKNAMGGACGTHGGRRSAYRVLVWRTDGNRSLGRPTIDVRIMLKSIFKKWGGKTWTGLLWLGIGTGGGLWRMWK
jgi:hypothetical protein